ncbi:hypothetical protein ACFX16_044565 [Malus domestica]
MSASIKICTRRSFRNRRGVAFSKAGLLRDHEGRSQKSKRRLLSQKLGCSKTTKADLRNRRGLLSQKLGCSETTRADLKNRREVCFLKSWAAQRPRGSISEIEEAPTFPALSAPVTRTQLCGNYGHSVDDFWRSRKHMNHTVQSPTSHTQQ